MTNNDYYQLLRQYARSHWKTNEQGNTKPWIDENMHPNTGKWLSRDILESWGWLPVKRGYERGKDYNHSLFCDLVLSGLLGIIVELRTAINDIQFYMTERGSTTKKAAVFKLYVRIGDVKL